MEAHFDRDRPSAETLCPEATSDRVAQAHELALECRVRVEVRGEGLLVADRLERSVGLDRTVIQAAGERVQVVAVRLAERRDEDGSIRRSIAILYGRSDVAAPKFGKGQIMVEGHTKLTTVKGVDLIVGGDAYLSVSRKPGPGARDVLRVWSGIAWGG